MSSAVDPRRGGGGGGGADGRWPSVTRSRWLMDVHWNRRLPDYHARRACTLRAAQRTTSAEICDGSVVPWFGLRLRRHGTSQQRREGGYRTRAKVQRLYGFLCPAKYHILRLRWLPESTEALPVRRHRIVARVVGRKSQLVINLTLLPRWTVSDAVASHRSSHSSRSSRLSLPDAAEISTFLAARRYGGSVRDVETFDWQRRSQPVSDSLRNSEITHNHATL